MVAVMKADQGSSKFITYLHFTYLLNILAWLAGILLLVYEYRKTNSETFYTHHLFWIL